jgi:plastocyanin
MSRMPTSTRRSSARRAAGGAIAAALLVLAACFSEKTTSGPAASGECRIPLDPSTTGATVVFIRDFAFHPASVTVPAGGRVVWVNCDDAGSDAHTSTSDGPAWDSGLLAPGEVYSRTFDQAGSFPYHCEPHPSMTGAIVVD